MLLFTYGCIDSTQAETQEGIKVNSMKWDTPKNKECNKEGCTVTYFDKEQGKFITDEVA